MQPRAPQGHPGTVLYPQPPPAPGFPVGAWLTWSERLAPGWGQPAPNPLPGLASKPHSDGCRAGCSSADFPSQALSALQAPAGTGMGGGVGVGNSPRAMQRGCPAAPILVSPHPEMPSHGATPDPGKHQPWPLSGCSQWQRVPGLEGAASIRGPLGHLRDTVPPQLTVLSGAIPSAAPAAPVGSGSVRTTPA